MGVPLKAGDFQNVPSSALGRFVKFRCSISTLLIVLLVSSILIWIGSNIFINPRLKRAIYGLESVESSREEQIQFRKIRASSHALEIFFTDDKEIKINASTVNKGDLVWITADQYKCSHKLIDPNNLNELMAE